MQQQFAGAPMQQQQQQQRYAPPAPQQQYGAPAPMQYNAPPQPQRYSPPMGQMQPQSASYTPPPVMLPQVQQQAVASYSPPPVQMPMGQPMQAAPVQFQQQQQQIQSQPQQYGAPQQPQQAAPPLPAPVSNLYTPQGGEMLQVTIFGTKNLPGANQPTVTIEIPGKHNGTIDTQAITGPTMVPKSLVTYITPGEGLMLIVSEQDQVLGAVELVSDDFYPNGVEGDLPLTDPNSGQQAGHLFAKIQPLGQSGQMADLQPVVVPAEQQTNQVYAAPSYSPEAQVVQGSLRQCSPEEFAQLGNIPGAQQPQAMMPEQLGQYEQQPPQYVQQPPQYAQQQPQQFAQQPQQYGAPQQPQYAQQFAQQPQYAQQQPVYGGGAVYR